MNHDKSFTKPVLLDDPPKPPVTKKMTLEQLIADIDTAKVVTVNKRARITEGTLAGLTGNVIGYDYMENEVEIQLDCDMGTNFIVGSEMIDQTDETI